MSDPQIQFPFAGGPNAGVDPRHLPPGSTIASYNVQYDADGAYQPRAGYTALSGASNPAGVRALYTYRNELLAHDGAQLWSWDAQASNWVSRDVLQDMQCTYQPLENASENYQSWASAVYQGYRVVAWTTSTGGSVVLAVYSIATGACVYGPTALTSVVAVMKDVHVGVIGSTAIVTMVTTGKLIYGATLALNPIGSASGWTQLDANDHSPSSGGYGADFAATSFVIVYEKQIAGTQGAVVIRRFNSSLGSVSSSSTTLTSGTYGFAQIGARYTEAENLWIGIGGLSGSAYGGATKAIVMRADPSTLAISFGPTAATLGAAVANVSGGFANVVGVGIERLSSTLALVAFTIGSTVATNNASGLIREALTWQTYTTGGSQSVASGATNCGLVAGPYYDAAAGEPVALLRVPASAPLIVGRIMSGGSPTSLNGFYNVQGSYVLAGLPSSNSAMSSVDMIEIVCPQIVGSGVSLTQPRPMGVLASGDYDIVAPASRGGGRNGLNVFSVAHAATGKRVGAALGRELYAAGGYYDGNRLVECGFVNPPPPFTAVDQSGSPANTFQYRLTYARVDNAGNLEESAPSVTITEVSTATPNVLLTVPALHLTRKQRWPADNTAPGRASQIVLLIYRTPALENGDGTFYLVTTLPVTGSNLNQLTSDTITYTDTTPDASLTTHAVLYTVGGELQHDAPETLHGCIVHNNRIFGVGADQRTIWFSQIYSEGNLPAWSLLFTLTIDDTAQPITALASLHGKLLIFTARRIYVLYGDGPSNANTGAEWTLPPDQVPSTGGCIDPRSIVSTPAGIMYRSPRGIELIGPDLSVTFIGLPVIDWTTTYPVCASASLDESTSTVRFCLTDSNTLASQTGGAVLVYDVRRDRWATHFITPGGSQGATGRAPSYASTYHPTLGYVEGHNLDGFGFANTGVIARQNSSSDANMWLDYGTYFVPITVQTAWIKASDLQGWQRVRRIRVLDDYHDAHTLTVTLDYDYQTVGETHSFTSNTIAGFVSGSWEQLRVIPARGKSEAIRVTLATSAPTSPQVVGTGRGAGFLGLAFEIRGKQGGYRSLSAGQRS